MLQEEDTDALDKLNNDLLKSYVNFIVANNKSTISIVGLLAAISYFIIRKIYQTVEEETVNNHYNQLNRVVHSDMIDNIIENQQYEYVYISLHKEMVTYNSYDKNLYSYINTNDINIDSISKSISLEIYSQFPKKKTILNSEIEFYKYIDYEYEFSQKKLSKTHS